MKDRVREVEEKSANIESKAERKIARAKSREQDAEKRIKNADQRVEIAKSYLRKEYSEYCDHKFEQRCRKREQEISFWIIACSAILLSYTIILILSSDILCHDLQYAMMALHIGENHLYDMIWIIALPCVLFILIMAYEKGDILRIWKKVWEEYETKEVTAIKMAITILFIPMTGQAVICGRLMGVFKEPFVLIWFFTIVIANAVYHVVIETLVATA